MRAIYKIAKSELGTLFYSPIAWLILVIFVFQIFSCFANLLEYSVNMKTLDQVQGYQSYMLFVIGGFAPYMTIQSTLYLYIPLLTMGLMSREYSSGSIKLLFSSPISSLQIILGKYLSMLIYGLIMMGSVLVLVIVGYFSIKDFDLSLVLSGWLGLYLLMATYAAIGLFMSTLTSYQIVAALGTLTLISFLNFIGSLWQHIEGVREVMYWFSLKGRADEPIRGLICSEDILYFILVSGMFLGFSVLKLQFARQSCSMSVKVGKYVGLVACVALFGYISTIPQLKCFYDATANKDRTITPNSQEILKQVDGGLTITSYVNLLDKFGYLGMPSNWFNTRNIFETFTRFKPETKLKSYYYYDNAAGANASREEMDKAIERLVLTSDINSKSILTPEQMREKIDLSAEEYRYVFLLERENGQKAFLRMYDDQGKYPSEAEISAVLKTMISKSPRIAFLGGHGERSIHDRSGVNYTSFTTVLDSRGALINQGYTPCTLTLSAGGDIPADIDVLVIADLRKALTDDELIQVKRYIERGGNLVVLGEPRRPEYIAPVLEQLGLAFVPGVLVQPHEGYAADYLWVTFTPEGAELEPIFARMVELNNVLTMPSATAIYETENVGFEAIPVFTTGTMKCWNELETKNFSLEDPTLNEAIGEKENAYVTGYALRRDVKGKEQRVFVLGDADCISNAELGVDREFRRSNYALIDGMFRWLVYDEYPIDISRPAAKDNDVYLTPAGYAWVKIFLRWVCPAILVLLGCLIWFSRRMK
ncbi:ABC transporter [Butyricimonas virosa]|jgi:ABC-2 type transport system permease protein|uniref:ABC transporter n=2 Tax=Butyricimonas virosa TaxID=544645 RepID=A0A413IT62_9BACT|nr:MULTISPECIES: Gldg family protein [Butyricimonas]MBO4960237.1 Gldg family protein [Butyricimonas sp.]MCI7162050.1 Gldg family protein [Butyricimonas virosa]MCI7294663.1 Gldg family protein [Butyricimonas virosa]MDY5012278.1 Gldg family protein [Butyricimonas virosa]MDY6219798.1 Gldg family protein [Butyricimonas virosa]